MAKYTPNALNYKMKEEFYSYRVKIENRIELLTQFKCAMCLC